MKGDAGDGVPNVLSSDNCFVVGERQKPLTQKRLSQYMGLDPSQYETIIAKNYERNAKLIDLSYTPDEIRKKVMEQYESQKGKDRSKLWNYFMANKLKNLMEHLSEF